MTENLSTVDDQDLSDLRPALLLRELWEHNKTPVCPGFYKAGDHTPAIKFCYTSSSYIIT